MTIGERIKVLRKEKNLSMEDFGSVIGMGKSAVSRIENGVNECWLRTGDGEMFEQTRETVLDKLCAEYDLGAEHRAIVEGFLDLTPQDRDVVLKYFHNVFSRSASPAAQSAAVPDSEAQRIAESDEYKSLVEKNEPAEGAADEWLKRHR